MRRTIKNEAQKDKRIKITGEEQTVMIQLEDLTCFIVKIKEKRLTERKTRTRSNSHRLLYFWHLTHLVSEGTFEVFSAKVSLLK